MQARRFCLYRAGMDEKGVDTGFLNAVQHTEAAYQNAHKAVGTRKCGDRIDIEVPWEGLPDEEVRTRRSGHGNLCYRCMKTYQNYSKTFWNRLSKRETTLRNIN